MDVDVQLSRQKGRIGWIFQMIGLRMSNNHLEQKNRNYTFQPLKRWNIFA